MDVAAKIIEKHSHLKDKILFLTQFKGICEIAAEYFEQLLDVKTVTYHGDKDDDEREKTLKIFRGCYEEFLPCNVLAATYGTLGEGVNLVEANVVILYDPPTSYAQNVQSQNRFVFDVDKIF